jgi:hypothetical protein
MSAFSWLLAGARQRLLGISPEEIRYTFDDLRAEIRATRAELMKEIDALHREIDSLPSRQDRTKGPEIPVAEA